MQRNILKQFIQMESFAGIVLFASALLALAVSNSDLNVYYQALIHVKLSIFIGKIGLSKPLEMWVNEGLMAVFFFLVGIEIKHEMCAGDMRTPAQVILPGLSALGGMIVPAFIYLLMSKGQDIEGWAIPTATDIAFSLGLISLVGKRVPTSLKIFLMAVAIFDDIGAVLIIAFFYTATLSWAAIGISALIILIMAFINHKGNTNLGLYIIMGILLWVIVIQSGIHATLAGFITALFIPHERLHPPQGVSVQDAIHPWVAYLVLPLFAFFNSGIHFAGMESGILTHPVTLGIILGLFVGKQLGIMTSVWLAVRLGFAKLPKDSTWWGIYGVALLCGVGFTMSLFIGGLAFTSAVKISIVKIGVLLGSILSGVCGYLVLKTTHIKKVVAK